MAITGFSGNLGEVSGCLGCCLIDATTRVEAFRCAGDSWRGPWADLQTPGDDHGHRPRHRGQRQSVHLAAARTPLCSGPRGPCLPIAPGLVFLRCGLPGINRSDVGLQSRPLGPSNSRKLARQHRCARSPPQRPELRPLCHLVIHYRAFS